MVVVTISRIVVVSLQKQVGCRQTGKTVVMRGLLWY